MAQEAAQRLVGLRLGEAVQVEYAVDRRASARQLTPQPTLDRRQRRRLAGLGIGGRPGGGRRVGRRLRLQRLRRRRQARPAPSRDAARDLGPQRNLLVAEAPQTMRRPSLLHGLSPTGKSTVKSPRWRTAPARAPAAPPPPKNRSARAGPTIADPVSCAIMRRRNGRGAPSIHGSSASIQNGRPQLHRLRSTAIERSGVSATPAPPSGPSSGSKSTTRRKNTNDGLRRMRERPGSPSLTPAARSHAFRLASDMALSAISPDSIRIRPIET